MSGTFWVVVLAPLTSASIMRAFMTDDFGRPLRRIVDRLHEKRPHSILRLLQCRWCLGFYIASALTYASYNWPKWTLLLSVPLIVRYLTGRYATDVWWSKGDSPSTEAPAFMTVNEMMIELGELTKKSSDDLTLAHIDRITLLRVSLQEVVNYLQDLPVDEEDVNE